MPYIKPSINHLKKMSNVLKTSEWIVFFNLPLPAPIDGLEFYKNDAMLNFSMMAQNISFPQVQSSVQEVSVSGFKIRVPVDTDFPGTITITFHETTDSKAVWALWTWQKAVEHPNTKIKDGDYKAIMRISPVSPISKQGPTYPLPKDESARVYRPLEYVLYGVSIAGINFPDLGSEKQGDIFRPTATFSYDWMDIVSVKDFVEYSY